MNQKPEPSARDLKVLFITAEADPFVKVGGLGDVGGSLPPALKKARPGLDIRLAIPFYGSINVVNPYKKILEYKIPSANGPVKVIVYETKLKELPVYLIAGDPIHPDKPVYGTDFVQDAEKFIFFSLACLALPKQLGWEIDVLHANDWHTAIAVYELSRRSKTDPFYAKIKSVLSLHNLPFMGNGSDQALQNFLIHPARNPVMPKWSRTLPLPMGLNAADKIVPVSPTYAQEILKPGYGCDLQGFLKTRSSHISGILNGIDYSLWDPQSDPLIKRNFSVNLLTERGQNKSSLQKELSLEDNASIPLLAFIGRMDNQKGIDLLITAISKMSRLNWQLIVLGTGSQKLEGELQLLQKKYSKSIRFVNKFDAALSHRIYAGADILLMPSRYEPCGLAQMIAMRYGCIPVANATGGLNDTIQDYSLDPALATGFLSPIAETESLVRTIKHALLTYKNSRHWQRLQSNAMDQDFSWQRSADKYLSLYDGLSHKSVHKGGR